MGLRSYFFRRAVRRWCLEIRLHRELQKEIHRLTTDLMDPSRNTLTDRLNITALALYVPDYRRTSDLLLREYIKRHKRIILKGVRT